MDDKRVEEMVREERNRYQREWRAKNKERVRAINARYWWKKARQKEAAGHETAAD